MITNAERSQIKQMLQMPQWQTVERMANLICEKIQLTSVVRESEWETLKAVIGQEGQIQGIRRFIQELYSQAQNNG